MIDTLDKKFWKFHALFWFGVATALFVYGLSYGHWQVALVRNIYSPIIGFGASLLIGILYHHFLPTIGLLRPALVLAASAFGAVISVLIVNPITYGLLGYNIQDLESGNLMQDVLYFILFYILWSILYLQHIGQTLMGKAKQDVDLEPITVSKGRQKLILQPEDIIYIQANGDYVEFFTAKDSYLKQGTIGYYEKELQDNSFFRVHRSIIVNAQKITSVTGASKGQYFINLEGGHEVRSSRSYQARVIELIPFAT